MDFNKVRIDGVAFHNAVKYGAIREVSENTYLEKVLDLAYSIENERQHKLVLEKVSGLYKYCVVAPHVDGRYAILLDEIYGDVRDKIANLQHVLEAIKKIEELVCI